MPRWELEVSDVLGAWGCKGRWYKPGVYTIEDPEVVESASGVHGVYVRELGNDEESTEERYSEPGAEAGPLEIKDLRQPAPDQHVCEHCGKVYKHQHKCPKAEEDEGAPEEAAEEEVAEEKED